MNRNTSTEYVHQPGHFIAVVMGIAVVAVGIIVLIPQELVIKCGADENGRPYAKVLMMNLLGHYHNANWTQVHFSYEGATPYDSVGFERHAHSISTTTVHDYKVPKGNLSGLSCSTERDY